MGKPFESELAQLNQTYLWSLQQPVDRLTRFVGNSLGCPLVAIGSGGSLTSAHFATLLHQTGGQLARAMTPLDFTGSPVPYATVSVLFLTAEGRNTDVLAAYRTAALNEARHVGGICMRIGSPLRDLALEFGYTSLIEYDLPSGKDGFLATNSLIASVTLLARAYEQSGCMTGPLAADIRSLRDVNVHLVEIGREVWQRDTWVVLYGGWALPAAMDLESKLTEAGLASAQVADYRNFGHGRHFWLSRHESSTGVIALVSPDHREIAERTIRLLPETVPVVRLESDHSDASAGIDLLAQSYRVVNKIGNAKGIDPGRPSVPTFGRRLYHLGHKNKRDALRAVSRSGIEFQAVRRKVQTNLLVSSPRTALYKVACQRYIQSLESATFGSVIFDYDGTLCDEEDRFDGIGRLVAERLQALVNAGIRVAVATGRGGSVGDDLRSKLNPANWGDILIGYYNGSDIATLADVGRPVKESPPHPAIEEFARHVDANPELARICDIRRYPCQVSFRGIDPCSLSFVRDLLTHIVATLSVLGTRLVASSHSFDVLAPGVTKTALASISQAASSGRDVSLESLRIGDRGAYPGNDFELLSTGHSLSVDSVSPSPDYCWNLAPAGFKNVRATCFYIDCIQELRGGFQFDLTKGITALGHARSIS